MTENSSDDLRIREDGDEAHRAVAPRANENFVCEHPAEKLRPEESSRSCRSSNGGRRFDWRRLHLSRRKERGESSAEPGAAGKYSVETHLVLSRRRKDRREPSEKLNRLHHELRLAGMPRLPEPVGHAAVFAQRKAPLREPRAGPVTEQALQTAAIVRFDGGGGVKGETLDQSAERTRSGGVVRIGLGFATRPFQRFRPTRGERLLLVPQGTLVVVGEESGQAPSEPVQTEGGL